MKKLLFCLCALFFLHCTEVPDYGIIKVSASPAVGGIVQKSPEGPEYEDGTIVTLIARAASGYEFVGWSGNVREVDFGKATIIVNGNDMVIANFVQIPDEPYSISVTSSVGGINIDWYYVPNATGYYIYRSTSPYGTYDRIGISDKNYYVDYDIQMGATYYYRVSAYNGNVEGEKSDYDWVATKLNAPTGVKAMFDANGITISWSPVSNATGYRIYRSTNSSSGYSSIGTSMASPYTDKTVASGTTYYYKVVAFNSNGEGVMSEYDYAITPPSAPTNVSATINSSGSITISWQSIPNVTGYRIYRSTSSYGDYNFIGSSTTASYTDNSTTSGTTYYYKVSASNSSGEGSQSASTSATTLPGTPTNVTATANSETSISISWSYVSGATEYNIYRSTSLNGYYSYVNYTSSTSYTDTWLSSGTTYYYKVSASNSSGEGSQSSYTYATTQLGAPTISSATGSTNGITVYWYSVSNAAGYYIYRSTNSSGSYTRVGNAASSSTSWTDTSVSSGTYYYYRVSAYSSSGVESSQSASVSAAKP